MDDVLPTILDRIEELRESKPRILVGIDGRCGSGKTSLATQLRKALGCPVIHMDDFYRMPGEAPEGHPDQPSGNVACDRFRRDVLGPLLEGQPASFHPYDCGTDSLGPEVIVGGAPVTLIEGSYTLHPSLRDAYDLCIFIDVAPDEQMHRIESRNSPGIVQKFRTSWIPMEETYIASCEPERDSDICFHT